MANPIKIINTGGQNNFAEMTVGDEISANLIEGLVGKRGKSANILVLGCESTPLTRASNVEKTVIGLGTRLNCVISTDDVVALDSTTSSIAWDGIIIPYIGGVAANYDRLSSFLTSLTVKCPVAVVAPISPKLNATVTGCSAIAAAAGETVTLIAPWKNPGITDIYAEAATTLTADCTALSSAASGNVHLWERVIGGCPVLFISTYGSAGSSGNTTTKPYLAYQWLADKNPAISYTPAAAMIRLDGTLENSTTGIVDAFDNGSLQSVYDTAVANGVTTILSAAQWTVGSLGETRPDVVAWFRDRDENNGGVLKTINHQTDVYNNPAAQCSSDHVLLDQFPQASAAWQADCSQLARQGFIVGDNGYGQNCPVVLDGNDFSSPTAVFFDKNRVNGGGGIDARFVMLSNQEQYPTNAPATSYTYNQYWPNTTLRTISVASMDIYTNTAINRANSIPYQILKAAIFGGAVYWHGVYLPELTLYMDTVFGMYKTCPNVFIAGDWAACSKQFLYDMPVQEAIV